MNGEQLCIEAAGYVAHIAGVGGALRTLTHDGRDLVVGFSHTQLRPLYRGVIAAPWPNRIGDGRYTFGGATHQLAIDEPDRGTALHGLAMWGTWQVVEQAEDRVVLAHELNARVGYPFPLDLRVTYALGDRGLAVHLRATSTGAVPAPYGCTFHPYLRGGHGTVDDWSLELGAGAYLETDERGLPVGLRAVEGSHFDFRSPRRIGPTGIDHAFTQLDGASRVRVRQADGSGVEMGWDEACSWVQIYTSDQGGGPHHRTGVAVEPMTAPPDAFRSGTDVVVLDPGSSHDARWTIRALDGHDVG